MRATMMGSHVLLMKSMCALIRQRNEDQLRHGQVIPEHERAEHDVIDVDACEQREMTPEEMEPYLEYEETVRMTTEDKKETVEEDEEEHDPAVGDDGDVESVEPEAYVSDEAYVPGSNIFSLLINRRVS